MSTINGIPMDIVISEPGKPDDKALVFMASIRRKPTLAQAIKDCHKQDKALSAAQRAMAGIGVKMTALSESARQEGKKNWIKEYEALAAEFAAEEEKAQAANEALLKAINVFYTEALEGAGYTAEQVDQYLPWIPYAQWARVADSCIAGCGRLDFFSKSPTQATDAA